MKKTLISIGIIIILMVLYGFLIEPNRFRIKENTIKIEDLPDAYCGFKIVQFSDVLYGSTTNINTISNIVDKINSLNPDLVVFTGDLISSKYTLKKDEKEKIIEKLSIIDANIKKIAIIGDNDNNLDNYKEIMEESNFKILDNEVWPLYYKSNEPIKITGITNINDEIKNNDDTNYIYSIVLTHYPDYLDSVDENTNLVIAGHSLNGQIRIPIFGGILKKNKANKYLNNYATINNTEMYVSAGIGTEKISMRLLNSPEINVYILEKK